MTRAVLSIFAVALLLQAFAAQLKSVTRDGKKVDFIECERCPMLAKWSEDGTYATLNMSRLGDGNPSAAELSLREAETLERVFAAMAMKPAVESPRCTVLCDDIHVVATNTVGDVVIENLVDEPRDFSVPLAELGLHGPVHALDITERAVMPDVNGTLVARVLPRETKILRLSPTTRQQE